MWMQELSRKQYMTEGIVSQTYGLCNANVQGKCEYLTLSFSPLSTPLRSRWRNNGLSADFLGEYVITFLPTSGDMDAVRHSQIKHAISYVANELLENAMKYHEQAIDMPIQMHLELSRDHIMVSATNSLAAGQAQSYREFVEHLLEADAGALYLEQLEASAQNEESQTSCLGLLTMINDYGAQLGWQFDVPSLASNTMTVTTSALLRFNQDSEAAA